jgi:hypothetical protein
VLIKKDKINVAILAAVLGMPNTGFLQSDKHGININKIKNPIVRQTRHD